MLLGLQRELFVVADDLAANPRQWRRQPFDLARGIVRRGERHVIRAKVASRHVDDVVLLYLNRLSDLLYLLARNAVGDVGEPTSRE